MKYFLIRLTYGRWASVYAYNSDDAIIAYHLLFDKTDKEDVLSAYAPLIQP